MAEVYFAAKKDMLCAKIVLLRWQNTVDVLKKTSKGGPLSEPAKPQQELELESEAALYKLIELMKTET